MRYRWKTRRSRRYGGFWCTVVASLCAVSVVSGGIDYIEGRYVGDVVRFDVRFSDRRHPDDGWTFQLFVDVDEDPDTGYGDGYELLVRGVEMTPEPNESPDVLAGSIFLRRTDGGDGPGGWGIDLEIVSAWILEDGLRLAFEVPLFDELGIGAFRYSFESYHEGKRMGEDEVGHTVGLDVPACLSLRSFAIFFDCIAGPDQLIVPTSQFCLLAFDYDGDSDVDVHDFALMPRCSGGHP